MYEIIQIMSTLYFRNQHISLAIITVTRIENYRDRLAKLIVMDFEIIKIGQLV